MIGRRKHADPVTPALHDEVIARDIQYAGGSEERRRYQREWARAHYVPRPKADPVDRLWSHVDKSGECWLWTGSRIGGGRYGGVRCKGRMRLAHRVTFELIVGPIPEGLELDHLCRKPLCVNPAHLEPVTHAENLRRGIQGARTHCLKGHAEPLAWVPSGRYCRECKRERETTKRRAA